MALAAAVFAGFELRTARNTEEAAFAALALVLRWLGTSLYPFLLAVAIPPATLRCLFKQPHGLNNSSVPKQTL
jgi:hypothetical protein